MICKWYPFLIGRAPRYPLLNDRNKMLILLLIAAVVVVIFMCSRRTFSHEGYVNAGIFNYCVDWCTQDLNTDRCRADCYTALALGE